MANTCPHCSTLLEGYETFCPGCGRALTDHDDTGIRLDSFEDTFSRSTAPQHAAEPNDDWFLEDEAAPLPADESEAIPSQALSEDDWFDTEKPAFENDQRPESLLDEDFFETPDEPEAPAKSEAARAAARNTRIPERGNFRPQKTIQPQRIRPSTARKPQQKAETNTEMPRMVRTLVLIACAAAALLLLTAGVRLISGAAHNSPTDYEFSQLLDNYFEAVHNADANLFISTRPEAYIRYLTSGEGSTYPSVAVYRSETSNMLNKRLQDYETAYGDVRSVRYNLTGIVSYANRREALSKVLTSWYNFPENSVRNAVTVSGVYSVQGTQNTGTYDFTDLLLIQTDQGWFFSPDAGSYWKAE